MEKIDYYLVGDQSNHVISNSFYSALNPAQGGSIQKAIAFLANNLEKKDSLHLHRGKLLHKYWEDKEAFIIAEFTTPTEMVKNWVDAFFNVQTKLAKKEVDISHIDTSITSHLKKDDTIKTNILAISTAFSDLANICKMDTDTFIRIFRLSRKATNSYTAMVDESKLIEKFREGLTYLNHLHKADGKIAMDAETKTKIESCIKSLENNQFIVKALNWDNAHPNWKIYKEVEVYWESYDVKYKAKLDYLIVDLDNFIIYYYDLKTTSNSIYLFKESYEEYHYERQLLFYRRAITQFLQQQFPDIHTEFRVGKCYLRNVVVETANLYLSGIYDSYLNLYTSNQNTTVKDLDDRYRWHKEHDVWHCSKEEYINNGIIN